MRRRPLVALLGVLALSAADEAKASDDATVTSAPTPGPAAGGGAQQDAEEEEGYDCMAELFSWRTRWPQPKRQWCCQRESRGCGEPSPAPAPASGQSTDNASAAAASQSVGDAAASQKAGGAEGATTAPEYDCSAGLRAAEVGWSDAKKSWCCTRLGRGCSASGATAPASAEGAFDCRSGLGSWADWPEEKTRWCCQNVGLACAPAPSPADAEPEVLMGKQPRAQDQPEDSVSFARLLPVNLDLKRQTCGTSTLLAGGLVATCVLAALVRSAAAGCQRSASNAEASYSELPRSGYVEDPRSVFVNVAGAGYASAE